MGDTLVSFLITMLAGFCLFLLSVMMAAPFGLLDLNIWFRRGRICWLCWCCWDMVGVGNIDDYVPKTVYCGCGSSIFKLAPIKLAGFGSTNCGLVLPGAAF